MIGHVHVRQSHHEFLSCDISREDLRYQPVVFKPCGLGDICMHARLPVIISAYLPLGLIGS